MTEHDPLLFEHCFPGSEKLHREVEHQGETLRVPFRRVHLSGEPGHLDLDDTSGPEGVDVTEGLPALRERWIAARTDSPNQSQMHFARQGVITPEMAYAAAREGMAPEVVR